MNGWWRQQSITEHREGKGSCSGRRWEGSAESSWWCRTTVLMTVGVTRWHLHLHGAIKPETCPNDVFSKLVKGKSSTLTSLVHVGFGCTSPVPMDNSWVHILLLTVYCIRIVPIHPSLCLSAVKMAELLAIKKELTVIKVQIDGLLDCVDKMDRQRKDCSGTDNKQLGSLMFLTTVYLSNKMWDFQDHLNHRPVFHFTICIIILGKKYL